MLGLVNNTVMIVGENDIFIDLSYTKLLEISYPLNIVQRKSSWLMNQISNNLAE